MSTLSKMMSGIDPESIFLYREVAAFASLLDSPAAARPRASMSRPSTSHAQTNGHKRSRTAPVEEASNALPMSDKNAWFYPSYGHDSDEEDLPVSTPLGNWGNKDRLGARWVRRGKMAAWGPERQEWEAEERTRKRIKLLVPTNRRSPSPPTLPHLRPPSPPLEAPYPRPSSQHLSYTSFVMDKSVTHSFRSNLLDELENSTNGLIEGEATMRRALGRLWQVISEDPDRPREDPVIPKREEDDDGEPHHSTDGHTRRVARAPDLIPSVHKLFMWSYAPGQLTEPSHFATPEVQLDNLDRAMQSLRELQDDGREYSERLQEIREGLGEARAQRNGVWDLVRQRAVKELQEVARGTL